MGFSGSSFLCFPSHTHTHRDVDAGRRESNKPGNQAVSSQLPVSFCGVGFLAELGWRSIAGLVQSPQINQPQPSWTDVYCKYSNWRFSCCKKSLCDSGPHGCENVLFQKYVDSANTTAGSFNGSLYECAKMLLLYFLTLIPEVFLQIQHCKC